MSRIPVRARLTIFFTLILALILAAVGFAVATIARNQIQSDMDDRLFRTAADIALVVESNFNVQAAFGDPTLEGAVPDLGAFTSRGLLVQVLDADGTVIQHSEAAPDTPLGDPPKGVSPPQAAVGNARTAEWTARVVNLPLVLQGPGDVATPIGAVIVGERTDTLEETVGILEQTLWLASLAGLALAASGGWWIARRALRPVDDVTAAAAAIAADPAMRTSLDRRLSVPEAKDELQRLALTFNAMLDQISSTFSAQRQFLADASHELRTPLTAIRGNSEVLGRQLSGLPESTPGIVPVREAATDIQRESERMGRLLEDLLLLARTDSMGPVPGAIRATGPVRLDEVVIDVSRTAQALAGGQRLHVETQAVATIGDRDRLAQMILVLVDNALRHTAPGQSITVSARCDGNESLVMVADQGAGIAPADLPRIFDRFYRVDASRERQTGGAGLGLAIAKAIAEAHGGAITVESVVGAGSIFSVRLPGCTVVEATQLPATSA